MVKIERGPQRLALQSGSTTIVLDQGADKAILQRKLLFWARKPVERAFSSIAGARVETNIDPASKAEISNVMVLFRNGGGWVLSARDKQDATSAVDAIREFLGE